MMRSVPRTPIISQYAIGDTENLNVPSKPKQVGELSAATHPPTDWIAVSKSQNPLKEFIRFINGHLFLPLAESLKGTRRG
jgi:hypothetical protein